MREELLVRNGKDAAAYIPLEEMLDLCTIMIKQHPDRVYNTDIWYDFYGKSLKVERGTREDVAGKMINHFLVFALRQKKLDML
jgi:hypothetical protein